MQYVWQHRLWCSDDMVTVDGRALRVLDPGLLNHDAGPDFFNGKIVLDGHTWVGNIELHVRVSDWHRHGHDGNPAYDNVVLHVVDVDDAVVTRSDGTPIPQVVLRRSPSFDHYFNVLDHPTSLMPCREHLSHLSRVELLSWTEALAVERLQAKAGHVQELLQAYNGSWEDVCYVMLARVLGFGVNNDAFEQLARRTPLNLLHKHGDSLLQLEALLLGQAGLLQQVAWDNDYARHLQGEYAFLANKFSLRPLDPSQWKMFRMRPANLPYRRIALLAHWVHGGFNLFGDIMDASTVADLRDLFDVTLTGHWAAHYTLDGRPSARGARALSPASIDIVLINVVAPLLFARGRAIGNEAMADRALAMLQGLKPEQNNVVRAFGRYGLDCPDAFTSQAWLQLRRAYCEPRKCIYCRIGHDMLHYVAHEPDVPYGKSQGGSISNETFKDKTIEK